MLYVVVCACMRTIIENDCVKREDTCWNRWLWISWKKHKRKKNPDKFLYMGSMDSMDRVCPLKEPPLWHDGIVFSFRFTSFHFVSFGDCICFPVGGDSEGSCFSGNLSFGVFCFGNSASAEKCDVTTWLSQINCYVCLFAVQFSGFSNFNLFNCYNCSGLFWRGLVGRSEFLICVACCCVKNWGMFSNCLETNHLAIQNGMHDPITPKQRACYAYVGRYSGMFCK